MSTIMKIYQIIIIQKMKKVDEDKINEDKINEDKINEDHIK